MHTPLLARYLHAHLSRHRRFSIFIVSVTVNHQQQQQQQHPFRACQVPATACSVPQYIYHTDLQQSRTCGLGSAPTPGVAASPARDAAAATAILVRYRVNGSSQATS